MTEEERKNLIIKAFNLKEKAVFYKLIKILDVYQLMNSHGVALPRYLGNAYLGVRFDKPYLYISPPTSLGFFNSMTLFKEDLDVPYLKKLDTGDTILKFLMQLDVDSYIKNNALYFDESNHLVLDILT